MSSEGSVRTVAHSASDAELEVLSSDLSTLEKQLRFLRACRTRQHDFLQTVVDCGTNIVKSDSILRTIGEECSASICWFSAQFVLDWSVCEQVFVATLQLGWSPDPDLGRICLKRLKSRFPESVHVQRLIGLLLESEGDVNRASFVYEREVKEHPLEVSVSKRRAILPLLSGDVKGTIVGVVDYLKQFGADEDAWLCLGDLYLSEGEFESAAACFEELILLSPDCYLFPLRVAEIFLTIGVRSYVEDSLFYFSQSLELKPVDNARAAFGLLRAAEWLVRRDQKKSKGGDGGNLSSLAEVARLALAEMHENSPVKRYAEHLWAAKRV